MELESVFHYALYAMLVGYVVIVGRFIYFNQRLKNGRWLLVAIVSWPLFMFDEWLRMWQLSSLSHLYGLCDVFAVLLISAVYRVVITKIVAAPKWQWWLWAPLGLTLVLQSSVLLLPTVEKSAWFVSSPIGAPLLLWPAYVAPLITGFSVLFLGILITEQLHIYHHYLSCQVVEPQDFRIRKITSIMGSTVGVAFVAILLVTAVTFGFFYLPFWQPLFHFILALPLLAALLYLTKPRKTSPSPLDYQRLNAGGLSSAEMCATIARAERTMIDSKAYKRLGLTLTEFCEQAAINATNLALALQVERKQNFRRFVYQYRLDYAKNILLRTDANIAKVARRLGLNSDKFLGEVMVKHFKNNP
jgi:AraC-like DNA-binding protein